MSLGRSRLNQRGGVLLDLVLAFALVMLGAFALNAVGISFREILHGASRFFGLG
jgi:hypothetical protein